MPSARPSERPEPSADQPSAAICFENVGRKRFTRAEADRSLAYVAPIVGDVQRQYEHILELRRAMTAGQVAQASSDRPAAADTAYESAMDRLGELVDELHAVGVELRDFEAGLIAFPCDHKNRTMLLSWQPGESSVGHFHEQDESVADRRPISQLA